MGFVDTPSDKSPDGAWYHRVMMTTECAQGAIPSLIGRGLHFCPQFDRHNCWPFIFTGKKTDLRRMCGLVTVARVVEKAIQFGGYLYAPDFPEIVRKLGRKPIVGCSWELTAHVVNKDSEIWEIKRATFVGVALLHQNKAAYSSAWVELGELAK